MSEYMCVHVATWLSNITNWFTEEYICQEIFKYLNIFEYSSQSILYGDSLTMVTLQVAGAGGRGRSHTLASRANTVGQISLEENLNCLGLWHIVQPVLQEVQSK